MISGLFPAVGKVLITAVALSLVQCGDNKDDQNGGGDSRTASEAAFDQAAAEHQIPVRLLVASGFVESELNPAASSSAGLAGPENSESAFGISRSRLGIAAGSGGDRLSTQTEAYARWISRGLSGGLKAPPETNEDKFKWIWAFAEVHRSSDSTRILYARELITALNRGFQWIDPETFRIITVEPESPPIDPDNLKAVFRNHLNLTSLTRVSPDNINAARFLPRPLQDNHNRSQNPQRIRIAHCPFSFSTCTELQLWDGTSPKNFWLGAHYLIPQGEDQFDNPLQIELHERAVPVTQENGDLSFSQDEIVIMLTGSAGRITNGKRNPANPDWLTPWQLIRMGHLIEDICGWLVRNGGIQNLQQCKTRGTGIQFFHQETGTYQWGQIPDFDSTIFEAYIHNPQMLTGNTVFEFPGNKIFFKASEPVTLNLTFGLRVRSIQLERMIRCPGSESVRWSVISRDRVSGVSSFLYQKVIPDSGANQNGTHFFRAKTFGEDGKHLAGWAHATAYLTEYSPGPSTAFPGDCP